MGALATGASMADSERKSAARRTDECLSFLPGDRIRCTTGLAPCFTAGYIEQPAAPRFKD